MSNADFHTQPALFSRADRFDDEIDLIALVASLWRRRVAIVATTAVVIVLAVGYLLLATSVFQTNMVFKKANSYELEKVNIPQVFSLNSTEALERMERALNSYEQRFLFFQEHQDLYGLQPREGVTLEQTYADYDKDSFSIKRSDPKENQGASFIELTLNYTADTQGVGILRQFAAWVQARELETIEKDIQRTVNSRLQQLQLQLTESRKGYAVAKEAQIARLLEADKVKRQNLLDEKAAIKTELKARRDNRIKQLEEAIVVAESLGMKKPSSILWEFAGGQENNVRRDANMFGLPLYFMGVDVLKSEREALLSRKNDEFTEPRLVEIETELALLEKNRLVESLRARTEGIEDIYLEDFSNIQKTIAKLNAIELDLSDVNLVKVDRDAIRPLKPIKPRKALILAIAVVLGGMLGLFVALVLNMVESAKKRMAVPVPVPAQVKLPKANIN